MVITERSQKEDCLQIFMPSKVSLKTYLCSSRYMSVEREVQPSLNSIRDIDVNLLNQLIQRILIHSYLGQICDGKPIEDMTFQNNCHSLTDWLTTIT